MRALTELKPPGQIDPKHLHRIFIVDHFCLTAAGIIALINLLPDILNPLGKELPPGWLQMRVPSIAMTLCAVLSLSLSVATQPRPTKRLGTVLGILTSVIAAASFWVTLAGSQSIVRGIFDRKAVVLRDDLSYTVFFLVGIAILFASSRGARVGRIANGLTFILSFLVFSLVLGVIFKRAGIPSSSTSGLIPIPTLWCVALLTLVLVLRRTEESSLSFVFGYGTGSHIARFLAPIVVLLPMLREIARARLLKTGWIPAPYAVAFLTSVGTFMGVILLVILVQIINRMQARIQSDVLKDELTGLLSVKGFYLLAEQSFRQSRRTQEPFAVLFVDMDNLKTINDTLGHSIGSVSLVETSKLLSANFRDTDIIGRVGGDEFIVAGQFNREEIALALERLRQAISRKNDVVGQQFSISLSMGCAMTDDFEHETLHGLVAKADKEMYEEKRRKKKIRQANVFSLGGTRNDDVALERIGI